MTIFKCTDHTASNGKILVNVEGTDGGLCKPAARFTEWERKYFDNYLAFITLTSSLCLLQGDAWHCDLYSRVRKPIYRTVNLARLFQWRVPKLFYVQTTSIFLPYYSLHIQSTRNAQTA
jgi:hypothetical protein